MKPPGSTTPVDVFSTVPLEDEQGGCQEGALVCTCRDTEEEEEVEEEEEGACVVPGKLKAGLISSCRKQRTNDDAQMFHRVSDPQTEPCCGGLGLYLGIL